ncbi:MAG: MFS transporter, partial [Pseudomonadota bacterium]
MQTSSETGSPVAAWFMVGALWFTYVVSYLDRLIISLLIEPIKADFGLTDFQVSLLVGFSFVLFYGAFALPVAYIADRSSRKRVIMVGVTIWGTMTALCAVARGFLSLLIFRFGVGAGESALHPSAMSMLADRFPPERRTLPVAIFLSASSAGAAVAYIFGGLLVGFAASIGTINIPVFGELSPWQLTFLLVALPALISLLLMSFVQEPLRQETSPPAAVAADAPSGFVEHLRKHWLAYTGCILGPAVSQMATYAFMTWIPSLFVRQYGWGPEVSGPAVGLTMVGGGLLGTLIASPVQKMIRGRGVIDAGYFGTVSTFTFLVVAFVIVTALGFVVPGFVSLLQSSPQAVLVLLAIAAPTTVLANVYPQ